jgi:hypothetical protein
LKCTDTDGPFLGMETLGIENNRRKRRLSF